jgi:hypothetical protein
MDEGRPSGEEGGGDLYPFELCLFAVSCTDVSIGLSSHAAWTNRPDVLSSEGRDRERHLFHTQCEGKSGVKRITSSFHHLISVLQCLSTH